MTDNKFREHFWEAPKEYFIPFWIISSVCMVVSVVVGTLQYLKLRKIGNEIRKHRQAVFLPRKTQLSVAMSNLPPILAFLNWGTLMFPHQKLTFWVLCNVYIALALYRSWEMIIICLGGPERFVERLRGRGPYRVYVAVPCCCFGALVKKRAFGELEMWVTYLFVAQQLYVGPIMAIIRSLNRDNVLGQISSPISLLSTLFAMYGVHIVFRAAKPFFMKQLHDAAGPRFWVVKSTVVLMRLTELICNINGVAQGFPNTVYTPEVMGVMWSAVFISVWCAIITCLSYFFFDARDLNILEVETNRFPSESVKNSMTPTGYMEAPQHTEERGGEPHIIVDGATNANAPAIVRDNQTTSTTATTTAQDDNAHSREGSYGTMGDTSL
ncbi:unnamed protein product [Vitrella brassicaformis CCMP3155]|uniref:Uncharacterized protein n=2 Tax=Vitrella brassicaformis TaxID=1169539 RepID=A0A0G4ET00_VITBC|nr:unnamed protein product [Vitrella brassicaformis CCMP3155]|eukprot:CEM01010.1 unnamed protein product [Vitrella brassicaformis CCMP3155]